MLYSVNFQFSDRWEASITKMLLENYQIDLRFVRFDISLTYLWPDHELLNWNRFIEFRIINTPYIWKILNLILELNVLGWHPRIWILVRWKFIFEFWPITRNICAATIFGSWLEKRKKKLGLSCAKQSSV